MTPRTSQGFIVLPLLETSSGQRYMARVSKYTDGMTLLLSWPPSSNPYRWILSPATAYI
jgi:hypothetical protein